MQFGRSEKAKWALLHSCLGLIAREIGRKQKKGKHQCAPLADAKIQHFIAFCKRDGRNVDKKRWVSVGDKKSGRWSRGGAFGILRE